MVGMNVVDGNRQHRTPEAVGLCAQSANRQCCEPGRPRRAAPTQDMAVGAALRGRPGPHDRGFATVSVASLILLFLCTSSANAQSLYVDASVDRTEITSTETVTLTVSATSWTSGRIVSLPPIGSDFEVVNDFQTFQSSAEYHRVFILSPTRVGTLTIGSVTVEVQGYVPIRQMTDPITIVVTEASGQPPSLLEPPDSVLDDRGVGSVSMPAQIDPDVPFVSVAVSSTRVFVGEQLTVDYELFEPLHHSWELVGLRQPSFYDVWFEAIPSDRAEYERRTIEIEGIPFRSSLIGRYVVVPLERGTTEIASFQATVSETISGSRDIESPTPSLEVQPLPPGWPSGYSPNNVGDYDFTLDVQEQGHRVGDSIRVVLRVSGTGLVGLVDIPPLEVSGANVLPPIENREQQLTNELIGGSKEVEYVVVPTIEGTLNIGPLSFHTFDLSEQSYRTIEVEAYSVTISGFNPHADLISGEDEPETAELLASLPAPRNTTNGSSTPLRLPNPVVWVLAGFPPLFLVVLAGASRARARRQRQKPARLRRGALNTAKRVLFGARRMDSTQASGVIAEALRTYLDNRLGIKARALTTRELAVELSNHNVAQHTATALTDILSECEAARYGDIADASGPDSLAERAIEVLKKLEASMC